MFLIRIFPILVLLFGCVDDKENDTSGEVGRDDDNLNSQNNDSDIDLDDTDDTDDTGDEPAAGDTATISGKIDIQLYRDTVEGDREMLLWEDAYPQNTFPFGKLYVGAFVYSEQGTPVYIGYDIIENPQPSDNVYSLNINFAGGTSPEVRVFAILDYYQDNITGTDEPIGGYPQGILMSNETVQTDVDFSVLSPMYEPREPCDIYQSGEVASIMIDGTASVTANYDGADVAIFILGPGGVGPLFSTSVTPESRVEGNTTIGEAQYSLEVCENQGYVSLRGCWDRNNNGMFEPMDRYGSYVSSPGQSGNPISVKYTDLSDYDIQIPLSGSEGLRLLPFMSISGSVKANGLFDDLTEGGTLHITALKFRPQGSISVQDIEEIQSYDLQTYEWSDLQGKSEVPFTLMAPKETIVYLWAYIDSDNNGYVNESQEPVASAGEDDNGKFPTGNINIEGVEMGLTIME